MRNFVNAIVSIAILGGCAYGFLLLGQREQPKRRRPTRAVGVVVETVPIGRHEGPVPLEANGVVVPFREIRLAAEVRGRVIEHSPNLRPGRVVEPGEMLIKLDSTEYRLAVQRLEQQQHQLSAELLALDVQVKNTVELIDLAKHDLRLREQELQRVKSLVEQAASSQSSVEATQRAELTSRSLLVQQQNQARDLEAQRVLLTERQKLMLVDLERAKFDEQRTVIRSAIHGVVVQSMVEEHTFLSPGDPFAVIEDTSAMEVSCNLTLDDMYWIWNDDTTRTTAFEKLDDDWTGDGFTLPPIPVTVRFDLGARSFVWNGILSRQGQVGLDEQTRTVPCRVLIDDPDQVQIVSTDSEGTRSTDGPRRLMRGMFVAVQIQCRPSRDLLQMPERAVRPGQRVWIARDGKLSIVPIEIVSRRNGNVIIDTPEDVRPGDQVIVSPVANVRAGLEIKLAPSSAVRDGNKDRIKAADDGPNH